MTPLRPSAVLLAFALGATLLLASSPRWGMAEEWMYDPDFREGRPSDVLADGPPPLLRAQVDAYVDLLEGAFDLALTRAEDRKLRDAVEIEYGKAGRDARSAFAVLVAGCSALRQRGRDEGRVAMDDGIRAFRRAMDARLAASGVSEADDLVRAALVRRQEVVWPGRPPVASVAAESWLEMVEFLVSMGRNEDFEPTGGQRTVLRRELGSALHALPEAERERVRTAHRLWLRTKAVWDAADLSKRLALRWSMVGLLSRALPAGERIAVDDKGTLVEYARAAAAVGRTRSGHDAWSSLTRQPQALVELVDAWLGPIEAAADHPLLYR